MLHAARCANGKLGKATGIEMKIELLSDIPVSCRPFRMNEKDKQEARETIKGLLEEGIIRESQSPYASPILFVLKKTGDRRMCVDYRPLNKLTRKEHYPLPLIEDLLNRLTGCSVFTSLDLASGYHQVPKAADSINKTAFVPPEGQYEYMRMPLGLCNAPAMF